VIPVINQINLHEHKVKPASFDEWKAFISETLPSVLPNLNVDQLDLFNMNGVDSNIRTGTRSRLVVLTHHPISEGTPITSKDGTVLATYIEEGNNKNQLNIHPDVFQAFDEEHKALFLSIMKGLNDLFLEREKDFSWKLTTKKEMLTKTFADALKASAEQQLHEDKRRVSTLESDIRTYTQEIKNKTDRRIQLLNNIENAQTRVEATKERVFKDLDNIIAHPKVTDLYIKEGIIHVHTAPIYAYHDKTGDRYYIGNMRITMNPQNTDVRFFGDNPRKSYWTTRDPHPHVNGNNGSACLGNVGATIAELCSQMELYALTMICIDFLESVNTSDPAGRNIKNWDKVDESGKIIKKGGHAETWYCDHCNNEIDHDEEQSITVYQNAEQDDEDNWYGTDERRVCQECYDDYYHWSETLDCYIHNDYDEEDFTSEDEE
jgi:hypothetical protein